MPKVKIEALCNEWEHLRQIQHRAHISLQQICNPKARDINNPLPRLVGNGHRLKGSPQVAAGVLVGFELPDPVPDEEDDFLQNPR